MGSGINPIKKLGDLGWVDPNRTDAALERIEAAIYSYQEPLELTPMESRVVLCGSHGLRYSETAEVLGCSLETVKTHWKSIHRKLAAKTTTQACCDAIRKGLIP